MKIGKALADIYVYAVYILYIIIYSSSSSSISRFSPMETGVVSI